VHLGPYEVRAAAASSKLCQIFMQAQTLQPACWLASYRASLNPTHVVFTLRVVVHICCLCSAHLLLVQRRQALAAAVQLPENGHASTYHPTPAHTQRLQPSLSISQSTSVHPAVFLPLCYLCSGGKLLRRLSNFQKTVTCVKLSPFAGPDSAAAPRMLAGSLDGHVKIFELDDFKVTHASKYPGPVTGLGLSADCSLLAVGMADGMLSVRKHAKPKVVQVRFT
jgi:hypothetical protein